MGDPSGVERDLARYYDQEADDRARRALQPRRHAARSEFIASLAGNERVLEIGVGAGRDAQPFVEAGHPMIGVDLSPAFAAYAAGVGAHATLATARALPFRDRSFDVVWTMSTLMHVPNSAIDRALAEVRRVLSPGGVAAIGVWGGADTEDFLENARFTPPRLFSRRSNATWQQMLRAVGAVERYETWEDGDDPFWYQYAVVRRS